MLATCPSTIHLAHIQPHSPPQLLQRAHVHTSGISSSHAIYTDMTCPVAVFLPTCPLGRQDITLFSLHFDMIGIQLASPALLCTHVGMYSSLVSTVVIGLFAFVIVGYDNSTLASNRHPSARLLCSCRQMYGDEVVPVAILRDVMRGTFVSP